MKDEKVEIILKLITELENLGFFEVETNEEDRLKIAKIIVEVLEKGLEDEVLKRGSERWL